MSVPIITLDGPGGAGKGTLASMLAAELGWTMLDSGALYRLVGLLALRQGLRVDAADDRAAAVAAARALDPTFETKAGAGQRIRLAGEDVSAAIRTDAVSDAASKWAGVGAVRTALLARQRAFARPPGLVADGRDMGTVVFPNAALKLFVTASARERAVRRARQLSGANANASLEQIHADILARDARDGQRAVSPLAPAADARVIDTTGQTPSDSFERVIGFARDGGWL